MGVHSSSSITKYINFYEIIKAKNVKYPFQFSTQTEKINQERIGGVFLISIQKETFYYLIVLVSLVLKNLL